MIVTDVIFDGVWARDWITRLGTDYPYAKVGILTAIVDAKIFLHSVMDGAKAFFRRDVSLARLLQGLQAVLESDLLVVGPLLLEDVRRQLPHITGLIPLSLGSRLTTNDIELLPLVLRGETVKSIATRVGVSTRTADRRLRTLYRHLEARGPFEAGATAAKLGLV